jgi:FeS assembly protein IscX
VIEQLPSWSHCTREGVLHSTKSATSTAEDDMAAELRWDDVEDIAIALADKYRNVTPMEVRFTDLRRYVIELPAFVDDPLASNEDTLEAIQLAWHDEWEDRTR